MSGTEQPDKSDPGSRWFHRLVFSYWAAAGLTTMLAFTLTGRIPEATLPMAQTMAWVFGSILLAMFGVAGWEAFTKMRGAR